MNIEEKIDELMAHIFYIEGVMNRYLGVDLDQASKSVENMRELIKELNNKEE